MPNNTELITFAQWHAALRRIERENMKQHGRTKTAASFKTTGLIVEELTDRRLLRVVKGWRRDLKRWNLEAG